MKKQGFCPECEDDRNYTVTSIIVDYKVRGKIIKFETPVSICEECGSEFSEAGDETLTKVYREYRKRQGMLQIEQIKEIRKKYGLTQAEFSKLLGFGAATIARYESGALQDQTHDNGIQHASVPENMLFLLEKNREAVSPLKRQNLLKELRESCNSANSLKGYYEKTMGNIPPNILNGYRSFNIDKFIQSVIYFCDCGIGITKLNKLLFYMDFKHFKTHGHSITGLAYARLPFGPVPDQYRALYSMLTIEEAVLNSNIEFQAGEEWHRETYASQVKPDLEVFDESELTTIKFIKNHFSSWSTGRISDYSHEEKGYVDTENSMKISYRFAETLRI
jgi:putative zinc finger/helix-turn-helix YgiT family protein